MGFRMLYLLLSVCFVYIIIAVHAILSCTLSYSYCTGYNATFDSDPVVLLSGAFRQILPFTSPTISIPILIAQ